MKRFINDIVVALKGFGMGAANVIPGVSGGTIALLTGIFGKIVECLNSLMETGTWKLLFHGKWKEFAEKVDLRFLAALAVGVLVSLFSLAKLMEYVLAFYPIRTWAFFFGMIAASAVIILAGVKDWKWIDLVWVLAGGVLGVAVCTLSPTETTNDLWFIFVCGAIAICTMILPGISGSFILLILGKYEYIMNAVSSLNWSVLIVFALGCVVGIMAFSKLLHWLLDRYERHTMLVLLGFVIGSLIKVWPWNDPAAALKAQFLRAGLDTDAADAAVDALASSPSVLEGGRGALWQFVNDMQIPSAVIWALAGIILVGALELTGRKKVR